MSYAASPGPVVDVRGGLFGQTGRGGGVFSSEQRGFGASEGGSVFGKLLLVGLIGGAAYLLWKNKGTEPGISRSQGFDPAKPVGGVMSASAAKRVAEQMHKSEKAQREYFKISKKIARATGEGIAFIDAHGGGRVDQRRIPTAMEDVYDAYEPA